MRTKDPETPSQRHYYYLVCTLLAPLMCIYIHIVVLVVLTFSLVYSIHSYEWQRFIRRTLNLATHERFPYLLTTYLILVSLLFILFAFSFSVCI